jgi:Mn2+/Fe2+ NRAMP family transporter
VTAAPWRSTARRCAVSAATEPAGAAAAPGITGGDPVTISIPLVAIVGVLVLVAGRYLGLTAWQALVCLLAGFLLSATPAAPLAVHQSRHDIADATPPVRRSRACQQARRTGSPQHPA